jgi:hypothetical protein
LEILENGLAIDELIGVVKNAVKRANISSTNSARDLRVTSVQLTLNVLATGTIGGGIDFRVPFLGMKFSIGRSVTRSDTHTIEVTLVPPDLLPRFEVRDAGMEAALVDAIETVRAVVARAGADDDDPFKLQDSTVTLSFAVLENGSISFGFDGEFRDEIVHTMRVSLADTAVA